MIIHPRLIIVTKAKYGRSLSGGFPFDGATRGISATKIKKETGEETRVKTRKGKKERTRRTYVIAYSPHIFRSPPPPSAVSPACSPFVSTVSTGVLHSVCSLYAVSVSLSCLHALLSGEH